MPRFDEGEQNLKLIKGNIVLMGNPDQYGEILAENIFVEDITRAALQTLISGSNLVRGKYYRITNAVGSTLSLVVKAVTADVLDEVAVNSTNGDNVIYNITTDVATVPYADTYVPYTGATTNVDLGEFGLDSGFVTYDTTPTNTPTTQGTTYWNANEETLSLIMNGVTQQIGLDTFDNVKNSTGIAIPKGTAVRFAGTDGNTGRLLIAPILADGTYPSEYYMGVTAEAINNGDFGKVIVFGKLRGINTSAYNNGDILYVSSTVAGGFQTTPPTAPNNIIVAATVVSASNNGTLMVRATLGSNINNDEGVKITSPTTGQLLQLQSNGLWENKTKAQILGGTSSQFVKGDGSLDSTNYLSTISGISAGGELSGTYPNPSLVTSAVTGKALTGLSVSGSAVVSTDSILTGIGKLQNQINAVVGSVNFQGVWNASTNSPSLASGVGTKGYYYVVTVAGSTNLDGITDWKLGDWAIYDGTAWQKVDNTDAVVSVNGYTGIVTLAKADIGLGNVENTALSTWAGSTNITTLGTIGTGVWQGTAIADAYIASASTWNAKIGGSGTTNYIPKFTASGTIGDSVMVQNGNNIGINTLSAGYPLHIVRGNAGVGLQVENSTTYSHIRLQSNGTNQNSYLTFNATGTGSAIIQINDADKIEINSNGDVKLITTPTTSASTFDLITRNTSSGVLEKVSSNYYATAGSISGTTGKLAKFTSSGAVGDSIVSESASGLTTTIAQSAATTFIAVENTDNTAGTARAVLKSISGTVTSEFLSISGFGAFIGTSSNHRTSLMMNGSEYIGINATNGRIQTNQAADTGESFIIGGSARVNGNLGVVGNIVNNYGISGSTFGLDSIGLTKIANGLLFRLGAISGVTNGFTSQLNASNDAVIYSFDYGNVGIGTTSPSSYSFNDPAFLVVANTSGNSTLSIVSSTTGIGYLAFADGTTGTDRYSGSIFYSHSTDTMSFKTAGSDRLEISSTGAATFSSSVTSGSHTITSGNNITMTQGDIQFLSNSGYGILSADSSRLIAIQNGLVTIGGRLNISALPTSSAGLSAGDLWNNGGVVSIV